MTRPLPYLAQMYQAELESLISDLDSLSRAGALLIELGQTPVFRLVPGEVFQITLDEVMPQVAAAPSPTDTLDLARAFAASIDFAPRPDETATYIVTGHADRGLVSFTEITDPAPEPAAEAAEGEQTAQDSGGGGEQAPTAAATEPEMPEPPPPGPDEGMAVAQPDAGAAAPASVRPNAWSAEEDDRLVMAVAQIVVGGHSKTSAIATVAGQLGRPVPGTEFRLKNKLADRLTAEIDRLRADALANLLQTHQPDPAPQPVAEEAAGDNVSLTPAADQPADAHPPLPTAMAAEQADGADASPAPSADLSPIEAHLHGLPRKGGWTMERDHELLELICAGWAMPEISAEMSVPAGGLKARFDLLSGLHRNADDKLVRRWARDELLAALTPWVKSQAAE